MALIKVYTLEQNKEYLHKSVANTVKLIGAAALNVDELPTTPENIEIVYGEGIDLVGIDFILEVIAVKRQNQQDIARSMIRGLGEVFPNKLFSIYFNNISESGMANTPRATSSSTPITMEEAIMRSRREEI